MAIPNAAPHRERTALDAEDVAAALLDRARALSMVLSLIATNSHQVTRAATIVVEALGRRPSRHGLREWRQRGRHANSEQRGLDRRYAAETMVSAFPRRRHVLIWDGG